MNSAHPGDLGLRQSCRHCREIAAVELRQNTRSLLRLLARSCGMFCRRICLVWSIPGRSREFSLSGASNVLIGLRLQDIGAQTTIVCCRSISCLSRLVQNWMSLPLCSETFLSERGERFQDNVQKKLSYMNSIRVCDDFQAVNVKFYPKTRNKFFRGRRVE